MHVSMYPHGADAAAYRGKTAKLVIMAYEFPFTGYMGTALTAHLVPAQPDALDLVVAWRCSDKAHAMYFLGVSTYR